MPTLTRFLLRAGLAVALVLVAMAALATLVRPHVRRTVEPIDPARIEAGLGKAREEARRAAAAKAALSGEEQDDDLTDDWKP
ncbi:hypothetical protein HDIA_4317 [Hartmannibacter diazotrophicus]|uniref:Uncharacterized protein n=1 Tax=Hartmannibacter diazotrophicus TaxID=1482074 RepID=A0A2C9DCK3_9HYPH|nr:hypothetical protein [Hartmannibacter diazotrophicus]SON57858.1 hypothetical protein HDIA_4317 [Hartmannibacter diazotrophicus]